jgi:transcriptional regulator with XRE-family HTH domain
MLVNNHNMHGLAYATAPRPYPLMDRSRTSKPLEEREAVGQVLRQARVLRGLSQERAAEAARNSPDEKGLSQQTWAQIEKGKRNIGVGELDMLARAVGLDRETLEDEVAKLTGRRMGRRASVTPIHVTQDLPVRGRIQAGAWLQADDDMAQTEPRRVPASFDPRFPREAQYLREVSGDSVDQLRIYDGDLVHLVDIQAIGYVPITDDIVEVERTRFGGQERELTLKQVEVTPEGYILWPRSTNTRWREAIDLRASVPQDEEIQINFRGLVLNSIRQFKRA